MRLVDSSIMERESCSRPDLSAVVLFYESAPAFARQSYFVPMALVRNSS